MSCKHIADRLADYINSTLNKEEQGRVEGHLEHCESCREELEFLKSYYRGVESLTEVEAPINLLDNIHEELEKPQGFRERYHLLLHKIDRIKLPLEIAGIAAAAALFLFVISPFREMEIGGKKSSYVAMEKAEESLPEVEESFEELALDNEVAAPPEETEKQAEVQPLLLSENVDNSLESDERELPTQQEAIELALNSEPLQERKVQELNRMDDSRGEMENAQFSDEELSNAIMLEDEAELAEGDGIDGSYEVALVLSTFSKEEVSYEAADDYNIQKSKKRSFANKDFAGGTAETSGIEEKADAAPQPQGVEEQLRSILAPFSEATIEFNYQADGVTPQQAIIKVKTADYTNLLEQLATLGLIEGPQVDPVTVSTTHMRVVLTFTTR